MQLSGENRNRLALYYYYAREDKALCEELDKHLGSLKSQGQITTWSDDEILAGADWQHEISHHLDTADIILLLISPDLFTLNEISGEVLHRALTRHEHHEALLIPILLRPFDLEDPKIRKLKALPSNGTPVTLWRNRDDAFSDIARGIRQVISTFRDQSASGTAFSEREAREQKGYYHIVQSVFLFNAPLVNEHELYGRLRERTRLLDRTYRGEATSIIGPRRIGKTWLIQHMTLVASAQFGARFRIASIDATSPRCATIAGFVASALEELKIPYSQQAEGTFTLAHMERAVKNLKQQGYMPVLCIDEFEGLADEETFDLRFFAGLRAIAQDSLALVVACKRSPKFVVSDSLITSPFFNILEPLILKPFSAREAEAFIEAKGQQAGLDAQERNRLLRYGQSKEHVWLPARLQLVGSMLLEEKLLAQREDPDLYRPTDPLYWQDFERRLEEKYQEVGQ